jgi:hypothetical protein
MSKLNDYVCVLWGDRFEEAATAIFVTELRKTGLQVKLVGLNSRQLSGANGLKLLPDLTLGQALSRAAQAICVIIPCALTDFKLLKHDPRLGEFITQAQVNQARFIIKQSNEIEAADLDFLPRENVSTYPESEELLGFVRELAASLIAVSDSRPG